MVSNLPRQKKLSISYSPSNGSLGEVIYMSMIHRSYLFVLLALLVFSVL